MVFRFRCLGFRGVGFGVYLSLVTMGERKGTNQNYELSSIVGIKDYYQDPLRYSLLWRGTLLGA